jgi:hypothetical protein
MESAFLMLIYIYAYKHPQTKDRKVNPAKRGMCVFSIFFDHLASASEVVNCSRVPTSVAGGSRSWRAPGAAKCRGYQGIDTCIYIYILYIIYIILYYTI